MTTASRVIAVVMLLLLPSVAVAQSKATSIFAGLVVDSVRHPIANAEVSFPGLSINGLTNDNGTFWLANIPVGVHRVIVRRIGFGALDTVIVFPDSQAVQRRITFGRIVTLDSVVVAGTVVDPLVADFE